MKLILYHYLHETHCGFITKIYHSVLVKIKLDNKSLNRYLLSHFNFNRNSKIFPFYYIMISAVLSPISRIY